MWRKRNPSALLVGMLIGTATTENSRGFPQKVKDLANLGCLSEGNENTKSKRYMHPYVHYSIIYKGQDMETT